MKNAHVVIYGNRSKLKNTVYENYDIIDLEIDPYYEFIPGHRYLVFEKEPFDHITKVRNIHLGVRNENVYDMTKLKYCLLRNGVIFKFSYINYKRQLTWLEEGTYRSIKENFEVISKKFRRLELKEGISKKSGNPWYMMKFDEVDDTNQDLIKFLTSESYVVPPVELEQYEIIRTTEDYKRAFDYLNSLDEYIGLDYETNGIPFDDPMFLIMGVGLAGSKRAFYFDIEWMKMVGKNVLGFMECYKSYIDKFEQSIYTFNVGFEMRCTYLMFGKIYDFHEASAINVIDGNHLRRFSLKYTAMNYNHVASWDDEFDKLNEVIGDMIWGKFEGKGKDRKRISEPYQLNNYETSDEWKYICETYPEDIPEFKRLITTYWNINSPYCMIPSTILGKYCCLDSFHTRNLRVRSDELGYSNTCWDAFSDNLRLGAIVQNFGGCFKNEDLQDRYTVMGNFYMMWGLLNCLNFETKYDIMSYGKLNLPEESKFMDIIAKGIDITNSKSLVAKYYNKDKFKSTLGFDLESFSFDLTHELGERVFGIIRRYGSINFRARSIFEEINRVVTEYYNISKSDNSFSFTEDGEYFEVPLSLGDLIYYSRLKTANKFSTDAIKLLDINKPIESFELKGKVYRVGEVIEYCKSITNIFSNNDLPAFKAKFVGYYLEILSAVITQRKDLDFLVEKPENPKSNMKIFLGEVIGTVFLEDMAEHMKKAIEDRLGNLSHMNQLKYKNTKNWLLVLMTDYKSLINKDDPKYDIKKLYEETDLHKMPKDSIDFNPLDVWFSDQLNSKYPGLKYRLIEYFAPFVISDASGGGHGRIKWSMGWYSIFYLSRYNKDAQSDFLDRDKVIGTDFNRPNLVNFLREGMGFIMARKWSKTTGTYLEGTLLSTNRKCNKPDSNLVSTRWHNNREVVDDYVTRNFFSYNVCQVASKRWSSPWHTIPARSQVKRIIDSPPGYLVSYFDISSAEVRSLAYSSKDPKMLEAYDNNIDLYIYLAKLIHPEWDDKQARGMRWLYKILMLGAMYGMSVETMASNADISVEEGQKNIDQLFGTFSVAKKFIEHKSQYCVDNDGLVETLLGDRLKLNDSPDKLSRLGINQCIQGGTSVIMAAGFHNNGRVARQQGKTVMTFGVVHDSSQNYFHASELFEIIDFYKVNFTDYVMDKYGMKLTFDLLVGRNYYDVTTLVQLGPNELKLKSNYITLKGIIDSIKEAELDWEIVLPENFEPEMVTSQLQLTINHEGDAFFEDDSSSYEIIIRR